MHLFQRTVFGPSGLVRRTRDMFIYGDGTIEFFGVCIDGMHLVAPQDHVAKIRCEVTIDSVDTGEVFSTTGCGSVSFVHAAQNPSSSVTVGGKRTRRKGKKGYEEYFLTIKVLE